jgi:hypothetical protein
VKRTLTAIALWTLLAVPVSGQIAWDAPALISPVVPSGLSLFLVEPAGGDIGALGTFRHSAGPVGVGYRAAVAEESGRDSDLAVAFGIDVAGFLARAVEGSEVDLVWWLGGGMSVGSDWVVSAPAGIILGWTGEGDGVIISPYGGAHVALDITGNEGDALNFDGALDLGLDLVLRSGWMIRAGAALGDRESIAVGFRLPSGG